jgi:hypothetical protein
MSRFLRPGVVTSTRLPSFWLLGNNYCPGFVGQFGDISLSATVRVVANLLHLKHLRSLAN